MSSWDTVLFVYDLQLQNQSILLLYSFSISNSNTNKTLQRKPRTTQPRPQMSGSEVMFREHLSCFSVSVVPVSLLWGQEAEHGTPMSTPVAFENPGCALPSLKVSQGLSSRGGADQIKRIVLKASLPGFECVYWYVRYPFRPAKPHLTDIRKQRHVKRQATQMMNAFGSHSNNEAWKSGRIWQGKSQEVEVWWLPPNVCSFLPLEDKYWI